MPADPEGNCVVEIAKRGAIVAGETTITGEDRDSSPFCLFCTFN
jgi:hypothetical protein